MFGKTIKTLAFAAVAALVALIAPIPAQAVPATQSNAFYVATMGSAYGIYRAEMNDQNSGVAQAVTADTNTAHTYRSLASDSSHLYFADNNRDGVWDLVRTDFNGGNREVVAANIAAPEYIQVLGVSVYFTTWTGGLFWVPAGGGTPTEILGPNNTAGLGNSIPTNGFGPFAWANGKLYLDIYTVGLIKADWSFNNPTNATMVHPTGYDALAVTDFFTLDGTIYVASWHGVGYYTTTDPSTPVSDWTHINTSVPSQNSDLVYRVAANTKYVLYSTSQGELFTHSTNSTGNTVVTPPDTEDFGVTIVETAVVDNTSEPLANTGSDLNLLWAGLGLLAVGSALTFRRKN